MKTSAFLQRVVSQLRQTAEARQLESSTDAVLLERFQNNGDPEAFETIVRRHGACVLAVCRKVLSSSADVEDAFQATFLVLLQNARSIRQRQALPAWLCGVAHRIALKALTKSARRRRAEQRPQAAAVDGPDLSWREACAILHEELDKLPDKYRLPLLLCYLDGKSRDEAAQQLEVRMDVLRGRLARGREELRRRLLKRGITLSAGLLAVMTGTLSKAGPSAKLIQATLSAALGQPSAAVAGLMQGTSFVVGLGKFQLVNLTLLFASLLVTAGIVRIYSNTGTVHRMAPPQNVALPASEQHVAVAQRAELDRGEMFTYAGRVLDPQGRPLAGAKVYLHGLRSGLTEFQPRATTAADGQFRFLVRQEEFTVRANEQPGSRVTLGATASGCGAAVVWASKSEQRENLTLWLPPEQLVQGRILDLESQPITGVQVGATIRSAQWGLDGRPVSFETPMEKVLATSNILPHDPDLTPAVSDAEGRFTLRGLGKDWLYDLWIAGPTIEHRKAQLVTRPQQPKPVSGTGLVTKERGEPLLIQYGCDFVHVAAPSQPIVGVVRDKDTGQPIAGARVGRPWMRDDETSGWTTTDADGRYRLEGLSLAVHELTIEPPKNAPYLRTTVRLVADKPGAAPLRWDLELQRQRLITGQITERTSGQPVSGWVEYRPLASNPHLKSAPLFAESRRPPRDVFAVLDKDGRFSIPALPGRGVLVVKADGMLLPAQLTEADRQPDVVDARDTELLDTRPQPLWVSQFHAYRLLDLPADHDATCNLSVAAGRSVSLLVLAPDGKPCAARALGLDPLPFDWGCELPDGRGTIRALADGERRRLFLQAADKKSAAVVVLNGTETTAITVRLQPTGVVTGRLLDAAGKPLAGQSFQIVYDNGPGRPGVYFAPDGFIYRHLTPTESHRCGRLGGTVLDQRELLPGPEKTDEEGYFRLAGVFPDVALDLKLLRTRDSGMPRRQSEILAALVKLARLTVKAGEELDLGDLQSEKPD